MLRRMLRRMTLRRMLRSMTAETYAETYAQDTSDRWVSVGSILQIENYSNLRHLL